MLLLSDCQAGLVQPSAVSFAQFLLPPVLLLPGGQGVLGEDRNARVSLTQAASMTPGADPLGPALDYLISCTYSSRSNELLLLAGNNHGAVGCFPVAEPSAPGGICTFGGPKALLSGGHDSVSAHLLQFVAWNGCIQIRSSEHLVLKGCMAVA